MGETQFCLYCGEPDETRDHIFFACPFTFTLWLRIIGNLFGTDPDPDWNTTLMRLSTGAFDTLSFILLRLALQTNIYYIWREHNDMRHNGGAKSVDLLAQMIDKAVSRITSLKYMLKLISLKLS